ncbi:MAG: hypothetical protein RL336_1081 [Pseudomonadota bacterium]
MLNRFRCLMGAVALLSLPAQAIQFSADVSDASWRVVSSPFECRVEQYIPVMGQASFYQRAGEPLRFELVADSVFPLRGTSSVHLVAPSWNAQLDSRKVYEFTPPRLDYLSFESTLAKQLLEGLLRGYVAEIYDDNPAVPRDHVAVVPVRFRPAYRDFQHCMAQLLPQNFEQIARSKIAFASGGYQLSETDRERLREVARYVLNDKEVNAVYIDGHTDNVGERNENLELSRLRAEQVALYLIQQGVNPDFVALRYHADFYPLVSNASASNRAKNRRATVRLAKEPNATVREKLYRAMVKADAPENNSLHPQQ